MIAIGLAEDMDQQRLQLGVFWVILYGACEKMLNDIYTRQILALAADIPYLGRLQHAEATATAHSRLCGSTITVDIVMEGDKVTEFAHEVKACALGQASASVMGRLVLGSCAEELRQMRDIMWQMLKENGPPPSGRWSALAALEPVRNYSARHASTMLTFDAVVDAITQIEERRLKPTHPASELIHAK